MKYSKKEITEMLIESNAIEGVFDDVALKQSQIAWEYLSKQKELSNGVVLKTHKILMLHQNLLPNEKGYYRNVMVWIAGRPGLNAVKIPEAITQWILNANDLVRNGQKEPIQFLGKMIIDHHVLYEKIHPFVDGNGRTGRMFMNWERLRLGLPIHIIYEKGRQNYYKWFNE